MAATVITTVLHTQCTVVLPSSSRHSHLRHSVYQYCTVTASLLVYCLLLLMQHRVFVLLCTFCQFCCMSLYVCATCDCCVCECSCVHEAVLLLDDQSRTLQWVQVVCVHIDSCMYYVLACSNSSGFDYC